MRRKIKVVLLGLLLMFGSLAHAEVIEKASNGFVIKIITQVDTTQEQAYRQFLSVGEWWNSDHTWFGDAGNLVIEPRAGGRFYEKDGDREVLHMTVSYVDPGRELRMTGGLGPLQMMGVHGGMSWHFKELEAGKTQITHQYHVTGFLKDGLDKLAPVVDKVQTLQVESLKKALE